MKAEWKQQRMELFAQACRARGLPVTTQRKAVFLAILDRQDHPSADQIYDQIKIQLPGISRTTVYRILEILVAFGLINRICHPGSVTRFDPMIEQHHHLVCMHCERIIDLQEKRLNHIPWPDVRGLGFQIRDYHIHFRGICEACRAAQARQQSAPRKIRRYRVEKPTRAGPGHPTGKKRRS